MKAVTETRYDRGQVIAVERDVKHITGTVLWKVESQRVAGKYYNVIMRSGDEGITCDCPDFVQRREICKHCYAVMIHVAGVGQKVKA